MVEIEKILPIHRILLVWQSQDFGDRFVVGRIDRKGDTYVLTYDCDTDDFKNALKNGLKGFPAFDDTNKTHSKNVMEILSGRLTPRSRGDFIKYLNSFCLPSTFDGDDFSLIAQTSGKLLSDRFSFLPEIKTDEQAFDYLSEVAGTRHCLSDSFSFDQIEIGHEVTFTPNAENQRDANAIEVFYDSIKIGYVNRVHCKVVKHYLEENRLKAFVGKKNGTDERPLIYVLLKVR